MSGSMGGIRETDVKNIKTTEYVLEYEDENLEIQDVLHFNSEREARQFREDETEWNWGIRLARLTYTVVLDQNNRVIDEFGREYQYLT